MNKFTPFLLCALLVAKVPAEAAVAPDARMPDKRIKEVTYEPDQVVEVTTHFYRYTMIRFADHEKYLNHWIGDPLAWDVDTDTPGSYIFIKPNRAHPDTNLTLITDKRTYFFKLLGQTKKQKKDAGATSTYAVHFLYPREKRLAVERQGQLIAQLDNQSVIPGHSITPENLNHHYAYKGADALKPLNVFDDGSFTYFQFGKNQSLPAIFSVDGTGSAKSESLVNYHHKGDYLVVERVGYQYALRQGNLITCVYNQSLIEAL